MMLQPCGIEKSCMAVSHGQSLSYSGENVRKKNIFHTFCGTRVSYTGENVRKKNIFHTFCGYRVVQRLEWRYKDLMIFTLWVSILLIGMGNNFFGRDCIDRGPVLH
jgi:hypothetical protein